MATTLNSMKKNKGLVKKFNSANLNIQLSLIFFSLLFFIFFIYIFFSEDAVTNFYKEDKEKNANYLVWYLEDNIDQLDDLSIINEIERLCKIHNFSLVIFNKELHLEMLIYNREGELSLENKIKDFSKTREESVSKEYFDSYLNIRYAEEIGEKKDFYYIIKYPIESLDSNIKASSTFLFLTLFTTIPIWLVIITFFSKTFNKPLRELISYSEKISNMDFSSDFTPYGNKEIRILGENFRTMSQELEKNIEGLKEANIALKEDLRSKEELEEMRADFLRSVSHELKTPIAIILGYSEMLMDEDKSGYSSIINEEADKMRVMVESILKADRKSYQGNLLMEEINVKELVDDLICNFSAICEEKNLVVENKIDKDLVLISDRKLLSQILSNYLTNAIDYSSKRISLYVEKNKIFVYNTGRKIPRRDRDMVWSRFYKTDEQRNRSFGGSGVGLSIVKNSASILGKNVGFENKENGVAFFIEI